jgi:hypothetical protein
MRGPNVPDWRHEVCTALEFWRAAEEGSSQAERLTCIGSARPGSEPGWYHIDLRGTSLDTDQVESLRLSGERGPRAGPSYAVKEAVQDGSVVRVRVAEFVSLTDAYLWQNKQPAGFLVEKLREGIAGLADAGLAHDLAARRLARRPPNVRPIAGFSEKQREAYESCLAPAGVRLVWGPPGTGKTMVLAEAINALRATGWRVLLVSATNIAVDNALLKVIAQRRHKPNSPRIGAGIGGSWRQPLLRPARGFQCRWPSETVRWRPVPNDGHYGMWSACREVFDDHLPGPGVLQHPRRQLVNGMGRGPRAALIGPVMPQRPRTLLPRRVLCEF